MVDKVSKLRRGCRAPISARRSSWPRATNSCGAAATWVGASRVDVLNVVEDRHRVGQSADAFKRPAGVAFTLPRSHPLLYTAATAWVCSCERIAKDLHGCVSLHHREGMLRPVGGHA